MNSYILGFLAISLITILSIVGLLLVRKTVGLATLKSYHEVAGYLLSIVGMLYAVLVGFVIVDAMHHMQEVRELVSQEASGLANIFLCSEGLPKEKKSEIRALCHTYAEDVINDEWPALEQGHYSQKAFRDVFQLWKSITTYNPSSKTETDIHLQLATEVCSMAENHHARVISASHGVAPVLWFVLIVGGVFTIFFTYFFGVSNLRVQVVMMVLLSVTLSLNMYLVFAFGNPMSKDLGVLPSPFKLDLLIFDNFDTMSMPPAHPLPTNW